MENESDRDFGGRGDYHSDSDEVRAIKHAAEEISAAIAAGFASVVAEIAAATTPKLNNSLVLTVPNQQGDTTMGAAVSLTVGGGAVQATVQEFLNGVPSATDNGPIAFSSDSPAVCTIDPVTGLVTPVSNTALGTGGAAGVATLTAADAIGSLSDSVVVTVLPGAAQLNNSLILTVPPQAPAAFRRR
jgi:hypothetical protein